MTEQAYLEAILGNLQRAGVYHMPQVARQPLMRAAEANGFAVFPVDLSGVDNKEGLLTAIGRAMAFPDWFGHNFDALADCLTDLAWRPAEGYLVILEHCDGVHGRAEEDFVTALQVFDQAASEWREQGVPFWCLVDMQADGIAWLPGMN